MGIKIPHIDLNGVTDVFAVFPQIVALVAEVKAAMADKHLSPEEISAIGEKLVGLIASLAPKL
ncbi:MAG: hypothetical protein ABL912_01970 [Novosphingobium sp.]